MPMYSFVCEVCGQPFEKQLSFDEIDSPHSPVTCPNGHSSVRRLFSVPQIVYKGHGWYSKDHAKGSHPAGSGD